jgi:hypothetical protein
MFRRLDETKPLCQAGPYSGFPLFPNSRTAQDLALGLPGGDALAQWFRARTENARGTRKTMIVALARKLLIALWRFVREGVVPDGIVLRPAQ